MLKRTLSLALAALVPLTSACTTLETREYTPGEIPIPDSDHRIVAVTTTAGDRVAFDGRVEGRPALSPWVDQAQIVGPVNGQPVRVDLSEASSVSVEEDRPALARTLLLVGGVAIGAWMVASMVSYRGAGFNLDPER